MAHTDGTGTSVTLVISPSPRPITPPTPAVVVTHPRPHLPFTGFDTSTALVLMTLLFVLGVAFLLAGRRSTNSRRS
jgi:hypothetical protein